MIIECVQSVLLEVIDKDAPRFAKACDSLELERPRTWGDLANSAQASSMYGNRGRRGGLSEVQGVPGVLVIRANFLQSKAESNC